MSNSKRQQTMAKMARERTVRERRELKREKKQAAAAARKARAEGVLPEVGDIEAETSHGEDVATSAVEGD